MLFPIVTGGASAAMVTLTLLYVFSVFYPVAPAFPASFWSRSCFVCGIPWTISPSIEFSCPKTSKNSTGTFPDLLTHCVNFEWRSSFDGVENLDTFLTLGIQEFQVETDGKIYPSFDVGFDAMIFLKRGIHFGKRLPVFQRRTLFQFRKSRVGIQQKDTPQIQMGVGWLRLTSSFIFANNWKIETYSLFLWNSFWAFFTVGLTNGWENHHLQDYETSYGVLDESEDSSPNHLPFSPISGNEKFSQTSSRPGSRNAPGGCSYPKQRFGQRRIGIVN